MRLVRKDWQKYLRKTGGAADYAIIDPPWNYNDHPPKLDGQLDYTLWGENADCLASLIERIDVKYMFLWAPSSMLDVPFQVCREQTAYIYKTLVTWVKLTKGGKLHYGLGHHFRNTSEHLVVMAQKGVKPMRSSLRNVHMGEARGRTGKPRALEISILASLADKGMSRGFYLFAGATELDCFKPYDIDLVDVAIGESA